MFFTPNIIYTSLYIHIYIQLYYSFLLHSHFLLIMVASRHTKYICSPKHGEKLNISLLPPKHYYYYTHVRKYEELAIRVCVAGRPKYDNLGKCVTKRNVTRFFCGILTKNLHKMPKLIIFNSKYTIW